MKLQLTHSKSSRERYYLIPGKMGCVGHPYNHANHYYQIANGIDKGNGYQGYMSVSYFLIQNFIPQAAKNTLIAHLQKEELIYNND